VSPRVPQAGGIVFRKEGDRLSVLLVRSKKDPAIWVFPKGHIDPGETAEQTALRETYEEAGVTGELLAPVGAPLEYEWDGRTYSVSYFLIRFAAESPSPEGRDKQWLSVDDAVKTLAFDNAVGKLKEARAALDRQTDGR
jgi:8-oxo-dGTP pyrophosphatase MutT (NUDIX family)